MKKINIVIAALAVMMAGVSCNKEQNVPENPVGPEGKTVTINASIPEELTKVALGYTGSALALTWQEGDQIIVSDHSNPGNKQTFTLASGEGTKNAKFTGTAVSASSFDIQLISNMPSAAGMLSQTQAADGSTAHLGYSATLSGVSSYEDVAFTQAWATSKGGTFTQSGALHVSVTLPNGVAAKVNKVTMKADQDIFGAAGGTMVVNITNPGDTGSDNTFDVFATIPTTGVLLPKDLGILFKFGTTDANHVVYTRYYQTPSALTLAPGQLNLISLTGTNSDKYAGKNDDGSAEHPYLIADKYQLDSMRVLMKDDVTKYFKLVDDINMDGVSWTRLNDGSGYKQLVNFNGNGKTITKLEKNFFYVLKGTLYDLTLDLGNETITARGALAEYIQGAENVVRNVTVCNGKVSSTSNNVGGLIGCINSDSTSATITDCTVSDTDVDGNGVVGGLIGFADAFVTVSGCKYTGGTVETTARFAGGLIGSAANYNSVISNCQVEDAEIKATVTNNDFRAGGLIGQQQTKVKVKGCSVGKSDKKVKLTLSAPTSGKVYNAGGFVGVQYGTITKNDDDTRNTAFVTITAENTEEDKQMNLGGFVGYNTGSTAYCDADVTGSSLKGTHIGGFAGFQVSGSIQNSTVSGTITGSQKTGGFVGVAQAGSISDCSATTVVSKVGSGTDFGGFVGEMTQAVALTKCNAQGAVTVNTNYVGGFAGAVRPVADKTASISKCWSSGVVTSSSAQCGSFIGHIDALGTVQISDSYSTGNLVESNQRQGGFIGQITAGTITISQCYASGTVTGSFATGGLIGYMGATATVEKCAAWNSSVTPTSYGSANWSSAAVIGVAFPTATLTDNYRNPGMTLTAYWVPATDYNHPNVSSTHPLVKQNGSGTTATSPAKGQDGYPQFPYHGKVEAGKSLSELASTTLGWSSEIWDFSTALPTLK